MSDLTQDSDRLIQQGRQLVADNRTGGRHRRQSIGRGSAQLKTRHFVRKLTRVLIAIAAIIIGAMMTGMVIGGIGFTGVMITLLAVMAAMVAFSAFPRMNVPSRADLSKGDVRQMVGRTEIWLEAQRPALPPPAARIVEDMGVQLDALGLQLETIDAAHPAAREVRKLIGDTLPEMIDSYCKIPVSLRQEKRAGSTPDQQLTDGLGKISAEIDSVTRQLASGALDDLAIKHRYLDYKYGAANDTSGEPS